MDLTKFVNMQKAALDRFAEDWNKEHPNPADQVGMSEDDWLRAFAEFSGEAFDDDTAWGIR